MKKLLERGISLILIATLLIQLMTGVVFASSQELETSQESVTAAPV